MSFAAPPPGYSAETPNEIEGFMRAKYRLSFAAACFLLLFCLSATASAGIVWSYEEKPDDEYDDATIVTYHVQQDKYRMDLEPYGQCFIIAFHPLAITMLNTNEKTYSPLSKEEFMQIMGLGRIVDGYIAPGVKVVKSPPEMQDGRQCVKFTLTFEDMTSEVWLTKDLKGYEEYQKLFRLFREEFGSGFGMAAMPPGIDKEALELIPVRKIGPSGTIDLKRFSQEDIPGSLFEVPKDYKKQ